MQQTGSERRIVLKEERVRAKEEVERGSCVERVREEGGEKVKEHLWQAALGPEGGNESEKRNAENER